MEDRPPGSAAGAATVGLCANDVPHIEQYRRWLAFSAPQRGHIFLELDIGDIVTVWAPAGAADLESPDEDVPQSTRRPFAEGRAFGRVSALER